MEIINALSFSALCIFGISYFAKQIMLYKKNNIRANVFGKGVKPKYTLSIERYLKAFTFVGIGIWVFDALFSTLAQNFFLGLYKNAVVSMLGLVFSFAGVGLFIAAMVFMKTSWRAGIDQSTKTALVTNGLYQYSRNPAFLGLNLLFIGAAITYGNLVTILSALFIMAGLHLQILQEEKCIAAVLGEQYREYTRKTPRYLIFK